MSASRPWIATHRRSLLLVVALLAAAGVMAAMRMPVALFPQVQFPRIVVAIEAGDRPAERMAQEITAPVERLLRGQPGVRSVRSVTSRGSAEISLSFAWGQDMAAALLQAESAVNRGQGDFPPGTNFSLKRMDPTVFPCIAYSLTSTTHALSELRAIARTRLQPLLVSVDGVANVDIQGGAIPEWQVLVDPARLQAFALSLDDVVGALQHNQVLAAVGHLEDRHKLYLVMADAALASPEQIAAIPVRVGPGGTVRVGDLGRIAEGAAPNWTRATADGHEAVLIQVYQQPGGNTVAIARDIAAKLSGNQGKMPDGVRLATWYDQSELINDSARSVLDAILIGIALAAVVLVVFLRNVTITIIALVAVPGSLLATLVVINALGMSLNIMTLGGLAAAVGLIIDDAIVMIEHLVRRIRMQRSANSDLIAAEARHFLLPLAGSSAATVVIFVPLAFLSGITGAFFKALSLTMAVGLAWSFLIAWLVVPLLAGLLLRERDAHHAEPNNVFRRFYAWIMGWLLKRPWLVVIAIVPCVLAGWLSYQRLGTGFMPKMDEGGFILDYRAKPGTSLAETDRLLRQVEGILRNVPEVDTYSRRTGMQLGGGLTEANEGDFFIRLKGHPRRDVETIMDDVRQEVTHHVPGLNIEMAQLMEDLIGDLISNPRPIEISISGADAATLETEARAIAEAIGKVSGVVDVNDGITLAGDALDIAIDHDRAATEGLDPEQISRAVEAHLDGTIATRIPRGDQQIGVRVWTTASSRGTTADVAAIPVRAADGHLVPLARVATITAVTGQPQVRHEDLVRSVAVTARIDQRDLGSVIRDIRVILDQPGFFSAGSTYHIGGMYEQQQVAFADLARTIAVAALLVFVLLVFLYERLRVASAMMLTTGLSIASVFIGLYLTGTELNITALMGLIMVVGIVTEVAIIFYSECVDPAQQRAGVDELISAGLSRMRPIAMTICAAVLALMPLALGLGQGSAMQRPLAIAIISGLAVQFPLALVVLPCLLRWMKVR